MIRRYKLRAECTQDVIEFINRKSIKIHWYEWNNPSIMPGMPDVELEFDTEASIDEIKMDLLKIPDSHCMVETVKPIGDYTGHRDYSLSK